MTKLDSLNELLMNEDFLKRFLVYIDKNFFNFANLDKELKVISLNAISCYKEKEGIKLFKNTFNFSMVFNSLYEEKFIIGDDIVIDSLCGVLFNLIVNFSTDLLFNDKKIGHVNYNKSFNKGVLLLDSNTNNYFRVLDFCSNKKVDYILHSNTEVDLQLDWIDILFGMHKIKLIAKHDVDSCKQVDIVESYTIDEMEKLLRGN